MGNKPSQFLDCRRLRPQGEDPTKPCLDSLTSENLKSRVSSHWVCGTCCHSNRKLIQSQYRKHPEWKRNYSQGFGGLGGRQVNKGNCQGGRCCVAEEGWLNQCPVLGLQGHTLSSPSPLGCFGASHQMKDHLLLSQKTLKVGEGLHMLTSACGGEGMPLREVRPRCRKRAGCRGGKHCSHRWPRVCLFCLVDTSCWSSLPKLGSSLSARNKTPSLLPLPLLLILRTNIIFNSVIIQCYFR